MGWDMTWKTWLLLLLALAAGSAASYAVKSAFFENKGDQAVEDSTIDGPKERLLVAKGDLAAGTELNASNVSLILTSEKDVPRDGVFSFADFVGRKTTRSYKNGEPISIYDVEALEESQNEEMAFIPPGCSVVPIEICSVTKINGSRNYLKSTKLEKILKPGDKIDVVVVKESAQDPNSAVPQRRRLVSTTIVKDASVFAVEDSSRISSEGVARTSILSALFNSEQLEAFKKGAEEGKIKVVLENKNSIDSGFEISTNGDISAAFIQNNNHLFSIEDQKQPTALQQNAEENNSRSVGDFQTARNNRVDNAPISEPAGMNDDFIIDGLDEEFEQEPRLANDNKNVNKDVSDDEVGLSDLQLDDSDDMVVNETKNLSEINDDDALLSDESDEPVNDKQAVDKAFSNENGVLVNESDDSDFVDDSVPLNQNQENVSQNDNGFRRRPSMNPKPYIEELSNSNSDSKNASVTLTPVKNSSSKSSLDDEDKPRANVKLRSPFVTKGEKSTKRVRQ